MRCVVRRVVLAVPLAAALAMPAAAAPVAAGASLVSEITQNGALDVGEGVAMSFCVTNPDPTPTPVLTGTLQSGGNVAAPSGPQRYGSLAPGETACRTFTFRVTGACASQVTATIALAGGVPGDLSYVLATGTPTGVPSLQQSFDTALTLPSGWSSVASGTSAGWTILAGGASSPPNRAFAPDPSGVSDASFNTPGIVLPSGGSILTFRSSYFTEPNFDGGVLEISVAGGPYQDIVAAGGTFLAGGYSGTLLGTANPLSGRAAWVGNSSGFITTRVLLPSAAAGQRVFLRWRMGTDATVAYPGWSIDTVSIDGVTCESVPQNAPWGMRADVHGNEVTLAWVQPLSGPVAAYVLEVSVDGGSTFPLALPVGPTTAYKTTGPDGVFIARVRGQLPGGVLTASSGPVSLALGRTLAPPRPRNVIVTTNGALLNLAWSLDEVGGRSDVVLVEAGTAAGLANIGTLSLPPGTTSLALRGVGGGNYFVRLRQRGPALASEPSHEISFTVPGACAAPVVPPNLTVNRDFGGGVRLAWDLGAIGTAAPSSWVLEAGTAVGLSNVAVVPLAQRSLVVPAVAAGTYFVRVYAQSSCGSSAKTADVSFTMP